GPRTTHGEHERPGVPVRRDREGLEVLEHDRARAGQVGAGAVRELPAVRAELDGHLGEHRRRPGDRRRPRPAARHLDERRERAHPVRRVGELAQHHRLRVEDPVAGEGTEQGHARHAVVPTVACARTRVPSYSTADWPGATPRRPPRTSTSIPPRSPPPPPSASPTVTARARAGTAAPRARTWT